MKFLVILACVFLAGVQLTWAGEVSGAGSADASAGGEATSDDTGDSASATADASTDTSGTGAAATANGDVSATAGDVSVSASASSSSSSSDPFNQMEGACGCCPLPCCCVCNDKTEPGTTTAPASTTPFVPECKSSLCLSLVVDISASIGDANLVLVKSFLNTIVQKVSGGSANPDSRTSLVVFATNATLMYDFKNPAAKNADMAEGIINSLQLGKFTNTVEGMEVCINEVWNGPGVPNDCPKWTMLFSDGRSNYRKRELVAMSGRLLEESSVLSVGVTDQINRTELATIATAGEAGVILIDTFDNLDAFLAPIIKTVCTDYEAPPPVVVVAPPVVVGSDCFCCCPPPYGPQGMNPSSAACPNCV